MKILTPRVHGYVDYVAILLFVLAPSLFGFGGAPAVACYVIAGAYLLLVLFTAYPLGAVKVIPFTVHGGVEAVLAVVLVALPWLMRFNHLPVPRSFFVVAGVALAIVWLITNYRAAEYPYRRQPPRPSPGPSPA